MREPIRIGEVAELIGAEIVGDSSVTFASIGSLASAGREDLSHLSSNSYRKFLPSTKAAAVILQRKELDCCPVTALVVENPKQAFAKATQLFAREREVPRNFVHSSAAIDDSVSIGADSYIGPNVVIGKDCVLGGNVELHANVVLGTRVSLGKGVVIMPNVTLYDDVKIGASTIIHSNSVIGSDGFGFEPTDGEISEAVAQIGGVKIGEDVSIGAGTCIDCGTIDDTLVGNGVKIDNQVQIGHNCKIGDNSIICGQVGIVGSTVVGRNCILAGGVGIGGGAPIELCDGVVVSAKATITQSIYTPGIYSGVAPYMEHKKWMRNSVRYKELDALFKRVRRLEEK